jgi:hypothetical protein
MFKISCVLFTAALMLAAPALAQPRSGPSTRGSYGNAPPYAGRYPGSVPGRGWGPGWRPDGLRFLPLIIPQVTLAVRPLAPPPAPSQIH